MRRTTMIAIALGLAFGCYKPDPQPPPPQQQPQQYPPGYYPQQQGGYYPPPQQHPGYPQQPPPHQGPQQPPQQPQQPPTQPTQQPGQPYNPWLTLLGDLLKGGAPPFPPFPPPTPTTAPTTPPTPPPPAPSISARSLDLANAINQYRAKNGLQAIPISKSLSHVAETHVKDLHDSPKVATNCNGHSWTNKGPWTACCYTPDHAQAKCMWSKPSELSALKGTGFEITIGQPGEIPQGVVLDSSKAVNAWQGSSLHNDVILNKGQWASMTWRAMGAGIIDSHACAWFSDTADPAQ